MSTATSATCSRPLFVCHPNAVLALSSRAPYLLWHARFDHLKGCRRVKDPERRTARQQEEGGRAYGRQLDHNGHLAVGRREDRPDRSAQRRVFVTFGQSHPQGRREEYEGPKGHEAPQSEHADGGLRRLRAKVRVAEVGRIEGEEALRAGGGRGAGDAGGGGDADEQAREGGGGGDGERGMAWGQGSGEGRGSACVCVAQGTNTIVLSESQYPLVLRMLFVMAKQRRRRGDWGGQVVGRGGR